MKTYYVCLVLLILMNFKFIPVRSQGSENFCGSSIEREKLIRQYPEIIKKEAELEAFTQKFVEKYKQEKSLSTSGPIIIPIVFHIINQGGPENISDAQVLDEVRILNRDYNKQNADTAEAVDDFKYIIADIGIQFRLANIDPNGNCTNGIERINSDQTFSGDDYSKLDGWPRDKYLNVWVVQTIMDGAAGYAYFPGSVATLYNTPNMDGVLILSDYVGSIGTSEPLTSRALTHEIGHVLNLQHPWGLTNAPEVSCGDDGVDDTPITKGWKYCPGATASEVCNHGVVENYQNYMDYSYCSVMFTEGQKARMMATLNSDISSRSNLYTDSNLIATGVIDTPGNPCAPIANFNVNKRYVCLGDAVTFLNSSGNADTMTYYWEFPNGTPPVSTDQNPQVVFNTVGWQPAKLTVINPLGNSSKSDTTLVYVGNSAALYTAPYFESFEDPNLFNENEWASANYDANDVYDNNVTWFSQVTTAAHSGTGCAELNNYDAHANHDIDEIISPGIDLTGLSPSQMTLSFYYSLATFNYSFSDLVDSMVVYASSNCGVTWNSIYHVGANTGNLINAGYVAGPYIPAVDNPETWQKVTISIPAILNRPNVIFKFREYTSIEGNNLYIDDINVGDAVATGIEDVSNITAVNIYPNPGDGNSFLNLQLSTAGKVTVTVYDVTGKEVLNVFDGVLNDGANQLEIHGASLAAGVYVVNILAGQSVLQRKLIVN